MREKEALQLMHDKGIVFDGAQGFINKNNMPRILQDANMITTPNSGVPAVLTTYIDPKVVEILTSVRNAREIFGETKKGDWTDSGSLFKAVEMTGQTTEYTDFGNGATADVNVTYPYRENYVAQTHIRYGEREQAVSGRAMIDLASEKQRSAATIIDIDTNKFYLYGVANREIYGLLNEPNLPAALTPAVVGNNITKWQDKTTQQIYDDILLLFSELTQNSGGQISEKDSIVLAVSPKTSVLLGKATDFNVSVKSMLETYFDDIKIVTLPELNAESGDSVMLIPRKIAGNDVGTFGYSDKMRAGRMVPGTSWYEQKFAFGVYGFIAYYPFAIAKMTGV